MANKPDAANPAMASRFQSGITGTGSLIRNVRRNKTRVYVYIEPR